ncbi:MAG TPA: hypothetical protein VG870_12410 [Chitinophagaceae bacterium]|nr:hypothetical protein [Chitinophagaceae bacterium]
MKRMLYLPAALLLLASCQSRSEKKEAFFPVLSFLKSQVAQVDTSLYQLTLIQSHDSLSDTTYIKREAFRGYARDFLELPDLSQPSYAGKYQETKFFDQTLNRVVITYLPVDKSLPIQREEVNITPGVDGPDQVHTVYIDQVVNAGDSTVSKKMLWQVNQGFQIATTVDRPGKPEQNNTLKINWE